MGTRTWRSANICGEVIGDGVNVEVAGGVSTSPRWRKKMIFSTTWVPPIGRIPKRYPGQALNVLAKRAAQVGFGQVISSLYFF
jgi:hypothetical protein